MADIETLPPAPPEPINVQVLPVKLRAIGDAMEPVSGIVAMLEQLLETAKAGQLRGLGVALVYAKDHDPCAEITRGWALGFGTDFALGEAITRLRWAYSHSKFTEPPVEE